MTTAPSVEIVDVNRVFGSGEAQVSALDNISLNIPAGACVALIGPSGSGKTTLLNLIGALDRPTSGTVTVLGQDVSHFTEKAASDFRRERCGFVFQDDALVPELTVQENVELPLVLVGRPARERRDRVRELLTRLLLAHRISAFPATLSAGEKQRVAVARAIIHGPKILLADEPSSHLDSHSAEAVMDSLRELTHERAITVVVATHDPRMFSRFDSQIMLRDGQLET